MAPVEVVEQCHRTGRPVCLGDRDHPAQPHRCGRGEPFEPQVQHRDLRPVRPLRRRGRRVQGRDRRLQLVGARSAPAPDAVDQLGSLADQVAVPAGAVLFVQRHQPAVVADAGRAPRLGEQHQRQQAGRLGVVGHHVAEHSGQPDRLAGQVDAGELVAGGGRVALVEDQVEHSHDRGHAAVQVAGGRHGEAGAGAGQLLFGAADPRSQTGLGRAMGVRDLGGRQTADRSQGERHLGGGVQRWVAAEQQQGEAVVGFLRGTRSACRFPHGQFGHSGFLLASAPCLIGAEQVDHPAVSDPDEPAARVLGHAVGRPRPARRQQRLLYRVLGDVEAAEAPHQRAEHLGRFGAEQGLDVRGRARTVVHRPVWHAGRAAPRGGRPVMR